MNGLRWDTQLWQGEVARAQSNKRLTSLVLRRVPNGRDSLFPLHRVWQRLASAVPRRLRSPARVAACGVDGPIPRGYPGFLGPRAPQRPREPPFRIGHPQRVAPERNAEQRPPRRAAFANPRTTNGDRGHATQHLASPPRHIPVLPCLRPENMTGSLPDASNDHAQATDQISFALLKDY